MEPSAATTTRTNSAPRAAWRFSIRHILLWTAAIGLACVALRNASAVWVGLALAAALLILATALLLVIFRRGAVQAYWIGFALFGGLYVLLLLVGWISPGLTNQFLDHPLRPYNLATTRATAWAYSQLALAGALHTQQPAPPGVDMGSYVTPTYPPAPAYDPFGTSDAYSGGAMPVVVPAPPVMLVGPSLDDFVNVAHTLWTLLLAVAGGCLARWLYVSRPTPNTAATSTGET